MTDHYETLGIPRDADEATIRKARRAKANTAHPDKGGSDEEMQKVNRAYGVLIDPAARKRYDETGEDGPAGAPSVTSVAEEAFAQLVRKVIETDDTNLVKAVERTVKGADADLKASEATARRAVLRLEKRRAKIKVKGDKPNIAHRIIDEQIRGHDQTIARVEFTRRVQAELLRMAQDYEDEVEEAPPAADPFERFFRTSAVVTGTGRPPTSFTR